MDPYLFKITCRVILLSVAFRNHGLHCCSVDSRRSKDVYLSSAMQTDEVQPRVRSGEHSV